MSARTGLRGFIDRDPSKLERFRRFSEGCERIYVRHAELMRIDELVFVLNHNPIMLFGQVKKLSTKAYYCNDPEKLYLLKLVTIELILFSDFLAQACGESLKAVGDVASVGVMDHGEVVRVDTYDFSRRFIDAARLPRRKMIEDLLELSDLS